MTHENAAVLNTQAIELASNGDFPEAIACFQRAIAMERSNYLLWYNLGVTYRDSGCLREAKSALECANLLVNNGDDEILESLSLVCYMLGMSDEAHDYCQRGLAVNDDNEKLWNNLGVLYFDAAAYNDACDAFETAVTLDPHYYDALYNLRDTYDELGNEVGADECRRRMTELEGHGTFYA